MVLVAQWANRAALRIFHDYTLSQVHTHIDTSLDISGTQIPNKQPTTSMLAHNCPIRSCGMHCHVFEKVYIKDPLLLIGKNSLRGDSEYVTMTIYIYA